MDSNIPIEKAGELASTTLLRCAALVRLPRRFAGALAVMICTVALTSVATIATAQEDPDARAQALLAEMTLEEKIDMLHGELNNFYGFYNAPIERLGIPALTMADGPAGVRIAHPDVNEQRATQLPSPMALGATWDIELAEQHGGIMGREAHSTGHNVQLAPVVDIARVAQWGRVFETYGEDPLLNGTLGAASIRGIQASPVISGLKHYNLYLQETNRLTGANVVVDERTLQEIYTRPFAMALRDGRPGSVMCAFNQVNGTYACENEMILNQILKEQLGFPGWVMTDYLTTFETVPAILAGLDQDMPGDFSAGGETPYNDPSEGQPSADCRFCAPLLDAVNAGDVPQSRIDDAVLRILRPMFLHELFDTPAVIQPLPEAENGAAALAIAEQSMVLLKNEGNVLPLGDAITSIAVIGADADTIVAGGGSARVKPTYSVSPLEAIQSRAGAGVTVQHSPGSDPVASAALLPGPEPVPSDFLTPAGGEGHGLRAEYFLNPDFSGTPEIDRTDPYAALNGGFFIFEGFNANSPHFPEQPQSLNTTSSIRWTGTLTAPVAGAYELALTSTGTSRLFVDGNEVVSTAAGEEARAPTTNMEAVNFEADSVHEVRIEFVNDAPQNTDAGPQFKFGWIPPEGVVAPQALAAAELARTADAAVVVVRDYGSEGGDKPSLRLPNGQDELIRQVAAANPRTIVVMRAAGAVQTSDWDGGVPALLHAWYGGQEQGNAIAGILFGDANPSGKLPITMPVDETMTPISTPAQYPGTDKDQNLSEGIFVGYRGYEQFNIEPQYPFGHGLSYTTFDYADLSVEPTPTEDNQGSPVAVTLTVENTGAVAGAEVVQVYVGTLPTTTVETAPKALAGWAKVMLEPGEQQEVSIALDRESLSYWDVEADRWVMPAGVVPVHVGASSADIRLSGEAVLPETAAP